MKKLVYLLAVSFGASMFAACGSSDKAAEAADSANVVVEEVAVEEVVPDSVAADSVAADTTVVNQ